RVDFVSHLELTRVAEILQFLADYALVGVVGGVVWWWWAKRRAKPANESPFVTALLGLAIGVVLGAQVAAKYGNEPYLVVQHGLLRDATSGDWFCGSIIDSARLAGYAEEFDVVLACGPTDNTVDVLRDTRVHFSQAQRIRGGESRQRIISALTP